MPKAWKRIIAVIGLGIVIWGRIGVGIVEADECDNPSSLGDVAAIQQCIGKIQGTFEAIAKANSNNKQTLSSLLKQIEGLKARIGTLEKDILSKEKLIEGQEERLGEQYARLSMLTRNHYKRSKTDLAWGVVFSGGEVRNRLFLIGHLATLARRDRDQIVHLAGIIGDLENEKSELSTKRKDLEGAKKSIAEKADFYAKEVAKASAYETTLSGKISSLTARQNEILASKTGVFQTSVGDVPLADDSASRPDYNPGFSPAFAAFSFGAPHYRGLSQYGALGRAKSGQNYEEILKAYYGNIRVETVDTGFAIKTSAGTMAMEDRYILGIAEMPSKWGSEGGMEALKAQAIAARSYAMSYVGWRMGSRSAGGSICVTESCQVWKSSKADNPGEWREAVNATRGKIVVSNNTNEIISTWYASTSGGYQESYVSLGHSTPGFWDTPKGREGWTSEAYENKAGSPWFYKGWYKDRSGATCGRTHPWLNAEEMADILNAWKVRYSGNADEAGRVSPLDTGCWGGNPYSKEEMRNVANKYGAGYTSVNSVSVSYATNGVTANVSFGTDKGSVTISGGEFKTAFNLRAPGRVSIKSGLYNLEKK